MDPEVERQRYRDLFVDKKPEDFPQRVPKVNVQNEDESDLNSREDDSYRRT